MHRPIFTLVLLLTLPIAAFSQEETGLQYMDVFDLQYVSAAEIAPDGQKIAYTRTIMDGKEDRKFQQLWLWDEKLANHTPLVSENGGISHLNWSPGGQRLAFVSVEKGTPHLMMYWSEREKVAPIGELPGKPASLEWSSDGSWLLMGIDQKKKKKRWPGIPQPPEGADWAPPAIEVESVKYKADGKKEVLEGSYRQVFVMSAEGGAVRALTDTTYDHQDLQWGRDGKTVIFRANTRSQPEMEPRKYKIFEMNWDSGELNELTREAGPYDHVTVSPGGEQLAMTYYEDRGEAYQSGRLFIRSRSTDSLRPIATDLDRPISQLKWSGDGKYLFGLVNDKGEGKIIKVLPESGHWSYIQGQVGGLAFGRPYLSGQFSVSSDGSQWAFTYSDPHRPAELALGGNQQTSKVLTNVNAAVWQSVATGKVEEITFSSSFDGREIQGWMIHPPNFSADSSYPMILEIHGGPYAAYGPHFSAELQLMAARGYVVLYINPRGSTGYGEEFSSLINLNYPGEDYQDLMSGVDAAIERGYIESTQLFITGGSGGGVLTAWSIGKTDRFRAAVVAKPVINWISFNLMADNYAYYSQYWSGPMPWEDPHRLWVRSPLSLVENVKTPTMILTGEDDHRTPISESEQYYGALQLLGVESAMIRIPEAGHGIAARPSNLIRKTAYILSWFDRYRD